VTFRANARRDAVRQLAELRTRLEAAEDALAGAEASLKEAQTRFDAADAQVAKAEDALHAAYADREAARYDRYAGRQAHERASTQVERIRRRVGELTDRLGHMP
jgi:uncharacterized protein (DUF3084 family)